MSAPGLGVVIPTLDEASHLPALLADLETLEALVVVADGGSGDGTRDIARDAGALVVQAPRGRARQLRAGAAATDTPWILFVHADSRFPSGAAEALRSFVRTADEREFAHFRFALDGDRPVHRFLELGQRVRERVLGLAYGDQGLVVSRALYDRVGGFPDWPILEDVGILQRLARVGTRRALPADLVTSARRYETEGAVRGWLRNSAIIALYGLGASPHRLAERFPRPSARPAAPRRTVVVFAKAPRPGRVKTRLAADLGTTAATRIYRMLGKATVDALRTGRWRVEVHVDPPDGSALAEVRAWLATDAVAYRPQRGEDLGERMSRALGACLGDADEVCIVGTDVPDLGADAVEAAFEALSRHDLVLGPCTDGGYYLLALRRPMPELFEDVPWSSARVLEVTVDRARERGARVALLDPKTDVDTSADVPSDLLCG